LFAVVSLLACPGWPQQVTAADAIVRHSFLGVGKANRAVIIDEQGAIA
jgi:hypothetical protein